MLILLKKIILVIFLLFNNIDCHGVQLIRDTEIEETLTEMVHEVFKVAGIKEKTAKVFVINSKEVNAFTIGSGYIFINSGLLLKVSDSSQMMGILAHETAHIAAGHINRLMSAIQTRSTNMVNAMIVGLIGTIATGSEAALAAALGYGMVDERLFLRYSRGEEFAADALAAKYLNQMGYDVNCMIQVFNMFQDLEVINGGEHIPNYIKSHPTPQERIIALKRFNSNVTRKNNDEIDKKYKRAVLKLKACINDSNTFRDEYSKAIWLHRHGKTNLAIELLNKLIKNNPDDLFYKETLAQCLYESGKLSEATRLYKQIYKKHPSPLINISYAEVMIESNHQIDIAIGILEKEKYNDCLDEHIYYLLSKAYGKKNRIGVSNLMLAQKYMLLGQYNKSLELLSYSLKQLDQKTELSYIKKAKYLKELIQRNLNN